MRVLAHGQGLATFFIVEAILAGAFVISLIAAFCLAGDLRARRRGVHWAMGFLAAAILWPVIFDEWIALWL